MEEMGTEEMGTDLFKSPFLSNQVAEIAEQINKGRPAGVRLISCIFKPITLL